MGWLKWMLAIAAVVAGLAYFGFFERPRFSGPGEAAPGGGHVIARATRAVEKALEAFTGKPAEHELVEVFFGTDRKPDEAEPGERVRRFGVERGELTLGHVHVSIPPGHAMGNIERPPWYLAKIRPPDPGRHMVLIDVTVDSAQAFHARVRNAARSGTRQAFVFVHGYRVTFEDAALRTAQMAKDLQIGAVPVFYSWPSQGSLASYTIDEQNAEWTEPHLVAFFEALADQSGIDEFFVVAHSMGTRAATRSLARLLERRVDLAPRFKELILAAPDIDADVFRNQILPRFADLKRQVTLYASSNDEALAASKQVHGAPRAGEAGSGLVVARGAETIDASTVDTDFLGHSYYGDNYRLLYDMSMLVRFGIRADKRTGLGPQHLGTDTYWAFKPVPAEHRAALLALFVVAVLGLVAAVVYRRRARAVLTSQ